MRDKKDKPQKPYPKFPLTPHISGKWQKKIYGKIFYFGTWENPQAALDEFLAAKDYLYARKTVPVNKSSIKIYQACNLFDASKQGQYDAGELKIKTLKDYRSTLKFLVKHFGKDRPLDSLSPEDFRLLRVRFAKKYGVDRLSKEIGNVRSLFKWLLESTYITTPMNFGPDFKKPSTKTMKAARQSRPAKIYSREELLRVIQFASEPLRTMILLGINCGFGQSDIASLERRHIQAGRIVYPRPKTAVERICPLWPETQASLNRCIEQRSHGGKFKHLVFVTERGNPWVRESRNGWIDRVAIEFAKLRRDAGIIGGREKGFYALRHTFETIADESLDTVAVNAIMGHEDNTMASRYREYISADRLERVSDYVRSWLLNSERGPIQSI